MTNMFGSHAMVDRQRQFAQRMRAQPTDAERVLWQRLRHDIALIGSHFRRQALVGPFIVDFASRKAKLVNSTAGSMIGSKQRIHCASARSRPQAIACYAFGTTMCWKISKGC
jgi:very-short-patch-repair endonuclease